MSMMKGMVRTKVKTKIVVHLVQLCDGVGVLVCIFLSFVKNSAATKSLRLCNRMHCCLSFVRRCCCES